MSLVVPAAGGLVETGDLWEPYCLSDPGGGRGAGVGFPAGPAGVGEVGDDAAVVLGRPAALVPVPGPWTSRGTGRRGPRPATSAGSSSRPSPGASGPCRLRCRASGPRPRSMRRPRWRIARRCCRSSTPFTATRDRPGAEPVPAGRRGRVNAHHNPMDQWSPADRAVTGRWFRRRVPRAIPDAGSTSCSRRCRRTGTGRWSRSGSPPGRVPRSCWALCGA